jgi:putative nucleotidyltransferase with HDIG domain
MVVFFWDGRRRQPNMNKSASELIDVSQVRIGMFIELGIGWLSHPFPVGGFKVSSQRQIKIIHGLNLKQVRYFPDKSDPPIDDLPAASLPAPVTLPKSAVPVGAAAQGRDAPSRPALKLAAQQRSLLHCERRFEEAVQLYTPMANLVLTQPQGAGLKSIALVNGLLDELQGQAETAVRLLAHGSSDRTATHSVNVLVLSLLLGKTMGLSRTDLLDLGVAAFLHDIGKTQLPERVRHLDEQLVATENKLYREHTEHKLFREHVEQGVALARKMDLNSGVQTAISQHHEMHDGSGFPQQIKGEAMSLPARILALANFYESLCNPRRPAEARTPHEVLSFIFTKMKSRFDSVVLSSFIRMMGAHPPGSLIQLVDERYALVVAANTARPLKPSIIVHDAGVPRHEALILNMEQTPGIGIRRSVKPGNLPPASADYLALPQRICYFFEPAELALAA